MKLSSLSHRIHPLFLAPLLSRFAAAQAASQPQELFSLDAFSLQQTCAQYCFTTSLSGCKTDLLGSAVGCANHPCTSQFAADDSCYCRGDLQSAAQSYLTSCIRKSCTVGDSTVNLASAGSIYGNYCSSKGFTAAPAKFPAATTTRASNPTSTAPNGVPGATGTTTSETTIASPTTSLGTSTTPSSSNTTYIVLGVIGAIAVLAAIIFLINKYGRSKPPPSPVFMAPYPPPNQLSTQNLQSHSGSSYLAEDDISQHDSVSNINVPTSYPLPPSLVSTQVR
ncbi:MAG: hypothetical protein M1813_003521 [Trichoglossum hirsutum]|nr:MAG: hypothetical protein M1813_003521 [Trichoglossum hirsutum]